MKRKDYILINLFLTGPRAVVLFVLLYALIKLSIPEAGIISLICLAYDVNTQSTIDYLEHRVNKLESDKIFKEK